MLASLLALFSCTGEAPPPTPAPTPTKKAGAPAPDEQGAYHFLMDEPGGEKGAPMGMAFLFTPGAKVESQTGPLSDGSSGFRFALAEEGTSVVCTAALPLAEPRGVRVRLRMESVTPGPQKFMGLQLELRSRDATGALVFPTTGRYTTVHTFREASDWQELEAPVLPPAGSVTGELCFRFVRSVGAVEVDSLDLLPSPPATATTPASTTPVEAPTCPEGCCPCSGEAVPSVAAAGGTPAPAPKSRKGPQIFPLPITWDLNSGGGKNGAASGWELIPAKENPATTVGVEGGASLFVKTTAVDGAATCSDRFSSGQRLIVKGRVSVSDYQSNGKKNSAFVVELRNFDAEGKLVTKANVRFQRLFTAQTVLEWFDFAKDVIPPEDAVASRLCVRFVESTGVAKVDWLSVTGG